MALMTACDCAACRAAGSLLPCDWPRCPRPAEVAAHLFGIPVHVCPDHADALRRESVTA